MRAWLRRKLVRARRPHRGPAVVLGTALLILASLTLALLQIRSPGTTSPLESEPLAKTPLEDDVPEAAAPPGEVRPGTIGGTPTRRARVRVVQDQLLVKFAEGTPNAVARAALADAGVAPDGLIGPTDTRVVAVPPEKRAAALAALKASGAVEYAERDVMLTAFDTIPNDAHWAGQWGPRKVSAPKAWDASRGSARVVIAVLDTGVDLDHPDLRGSLVSGYDFVNEDSDAADDHGHGTAAAGVIAARTNNARGVAGICWACSIMPVKVLGADGSGDTSTVARGIVWAADHGAHVISMSLGGPGTTQTIAEAVAYAVGKGVVLVAAAGNEGTSLRSYPAAIPGVVGVAATDSSDRRYDWSNYGPWVRVAAPGCNAAPLDGGDYGDFCGTSSATPVVAGLAGLVLSRKPDATRGEVEHAIESAATPIGPDVQHGRVDAAGTLSTFGPQPSLAAPPASADLEGRLTRDSPEKGYRVVVSSGTIVARVTFAGPRRLTLSIVDRSGRTIRRVSGPSPLRVATTVRAGAYRFVLGGRAAQSGSFRLQVSQRAQ